MKRTCVLLALTALLIALPLLAGCARKPAASPRVSAPSPPPSTSPSPAPSTPPRDQLATSSLPDEFVQISAELNFWQQSLSLQDRQTLESTGKLILSYQDLKTTDPEHAKLADKIFDQHKEIEHSAGIKGVASDLGDLQTTTFSKDSTGQYTFMLDTTTGASFRIGLTPVTATPPGK